MKEGTLLFTISLTGFVLFQTKIICSLWFVPLKQEFVELIQNSKNTKQQRHLDMNAPYL